jgi:hypothetical protein
VTLIIGRFQVNVARKKANIKTTVAGEDRSLKLGRSKTRKKFMMSAETLLANIINHIPYTDKMQLSEESKVHPVPGVRYLFLTIVIGAHCEDYRPLSGRNPLVHLLTSPICCA